MFSFSPPPGGTTIGCCIILTHIRVGTRSLYRIDAQGLEAVRSYLDGFWTAALTALAEHIEDTNPRTEEDR